MARYKDRSSSKAVERDFPHIVEIIVPPGGSASSSTRCTSGIVSAASRGIAVAVGARKFATSSAGALLMRKLRAVSPLHLAA